MFGASYNRRILVPSYSADRKRKSIYIGKYQIFRKFVKSHRSVGCEALLEGICNSHWGNGVRNGVTKLIIYVLYYRLWTNITWRFLLKSSKIYRRSKWQWKNIGETEINIIIVATINWKTLSSFLMRPKITFLVAYRKVKRAPQYCSWQLWSGLNAILRNGEQ